MKPKDTKERLFEVVARLDKTFKPKLNEELGAVLNEQNRPLSEIAREIYQDWRPVHPYAKPYLEAMSTLDSIDDNYMFDSGKSIVAYFLSIASTWRGETAKRIKAELKKMLGLKEGKFDDYDDEDDPDAGHTVNGVLLTPDEYRKWKEEEGEYDDMDRERYPRMGH